MQVSGYCGLLLGSPIILYEIIAFIVPGLTQSERRFLGPIVFGSSILFYTGIIFSYYVLTPAALTFFITYAEGVVESLWSIDQYFEFVLVLMFSTGLSFQVKFLVFMLQFFMLMKHEFELHISRIVVRTLKFVYQSQLSIVYFLLVVSIKMQRFISSLPHLFVILSSSQPRKIILYSYYIHMNECQRHPWVAISSSILFFSHN